MYVKIVHIIVAYAAVIRVIVWISRRSLSTFVRELDDLLGHMGYFLKMLYAPVFRNIPVTLCQPV